MIQPLDLIYLMPARSVISCSTGNRQMTNESRGGPVEPATVAKVEGSVSFSGQVLTKPWRVAKPKLKPHQIKKNNST